MKRIWGKAQQVWQRIKNPVYWLFVALVTLVTCHAVWFFIRLGFDFGGY